MPRRIAQERVPTASNVRSRDVAWASQPTPLIPFRVFSRVSRAPFLRQSGTLRLHVLCGCGYAALWPSVRSFLRPERL